jgi:hypothetical protein
VLALCGADVKNAGSLVAAPFGVKLRICDGETERWRDGETERRSDGETERRLARCDLSFSLSLHLSISPSLLLSVFTAIYA